MMRRYPVRSVLSERKMFSNGGMLPTSKPIESSMNQASGIMASSSPLIDAVSQEILAPFTGSAAAGAPSMTGAMPMAQGGVARFRNGGSSSELFRETRIKVDRLKKINALIKEGFPVDEAIRIVDGEGIPDVQVDSRAGPPRKDMNFLDPSVSVDKFNAIYGEQLPEGGPPSINVNEDLLSLIPEANRASFAEELAANERAKNLNTPASSMRAAPPPTDMSFLPDFKSSAAMFDTVAQPDLPESGGSVPRNTVDPRVAERLIELGTTREIVQDPGLPESGGTPPSGLSEVDALTRQRMAELGTTMGIIQDPGLPESGATQPSTVAEAVIEAAPPPTDMSFLDPTASVDAFDAIYGEQLPESGIQSSAMAARRAAQGSITPEEIEAGSETFSEAMSDNSGLKRVGGELSDVARIAALEAQGVPADQARERVEGERAQLELGEGPDNSQQIPTEELPEAQGDLAVEPSERLEEALRGGDVKTDIGIEDNFTVSDEAEASTKTKASTAEPGSPAADSDVAPENAAYISSPDKFAKEFANADMPEKEATKTLAAYKQEFMDEMPEYEGMSEAEKGFALMEAGLRVAAGESANAITNVAKGLKGLGATFAKDEKEKRAWNRQVNLSAAKYGLSSAQKDRDREIALAAEGRKRPFELIANENFVMDGQTIKKGQAVPLTNNQITAGYLNKFPLTYRETFVSDAKALAKLAEANKDDLLKPQNFSNDRKIYVENARSVKNGVRMKSLLLEAANIAIPESGKDSDVLGATPLFKSWVNKAYNAAGYQIDTSEGRENLNKFRSDKPEQYKTLMKTIGTTMVTEILNESNKTISEGDRDRVDQLVAAYSDFDGTVASYKSLITKLKNLEQSIDSGIASASDSMNGIEVQWGSSKFIGGGKASEVMQQIRQGVSAPGYSVGQKGSQSIPYKNIINMQTRKFTPKYKNIFGKQS